MKDEQVIKLLEKIDWILNDDEKRSEYDCLDKARDFVDKKLKGLYAKTKTPND